MNTILPALLGFLAGVLGATITPLIQWNIEKKRLKLAYRRELIASWRKAIAELAQTVAPQTSDEEAFQLLAKNSAFYSLAPHLDDNAINKTIAEHEQLIRDLNIHAVVAALIEEIERMEKEWGLI